MKIGDLVMWTGKDEWHGVIGVVTKVPNDNSAWGFDVLWADGTHGKDLWDSEIMAVEDESR